MDLNGTSDDALCKRIPIVQLEFPLCPLCALWLINRPRRTCIADFSTTENTEDTEVVLSAMRVQSGTRPYLIDCTTPARKRTTATRFPGPRSYSHSSTYWQGTKALANGSGSG